MPDSKRCVNTVNALWYIARTHNYGRHLFLHKIDTWIFYQLKKRRQSKAAPSSLVCRAEPCWSAAATLLCTVCLTNAFPQACSSEFDSSVERGSACTNPGRDAWGVRDAGCGTAGVAKGTNLKKSRGAAEGLSRWSAHGSENCVPLRLHGLVSAPGHPCGGALHRNT